MQPDQQHSSTLPQLTSRDVNLLAAESFSSPQTVRRVFDGGGNANSRLRVIEAAKRLGLPTPPARKATP